MSPRDEHPFQAKVGAPESGRGQGNGFFRLFAGLSRQPGPAQRAAAPENRTGRSPRGRHPGDDRGGRRVRSGGVRCDDRLAGLGDRLPRRRRSTAFSSPSCSARRERFPSPRSFGPCRESPSSRFSGWRFPLSLSWRRSAQCAPRSVAEGGAWRTGWRDGTARKADPRRTARRAPRLQHQRLRPPPPGRRPRHPGGAGLSQRRSDARLPRPQSIRSRLAPGSWRR